MRLLPIAAAALLMLPVAAQATTGAGCLRVVNVAAGDALNLRSGPSASSRIVDRLVPGEHGVIKLEAACTPTSRPWAQRWCPVSHSSGDGTISGYVKARYIRDADCP